MLFRSYDLKEWSKAAGIRALKTFAQSALSMITIGQAFTEVYWLHVLSVSGVAAIISILTSIAGLPELEDKTVDLVEATDGDDHEQ